MLNDEELQKVCQEVLDQYPKLVQQYKNGKKKLFKYFVRKVVEAADERVYPFIVSKLLHNMLGDEET